MLNSLYSSQICRLTQLKERKKSITTHELIKRWNAQQEARELLRLFDMTKAPEPRR